MKRLIVYLTAVLLVASNLANAQQFTKPVLVSGMGSGSQFRSPMMKLDRNGNIFIAWVKGGSGSTSGSIFMSTSTDHGTTFSMPVSVCADANANSDFQRTGKFVIDTKGSLHLIWMGNRVNNQPDIWYVRSTDQGKSWTTPITVCDADDSSKYAQDFPSIACDSSDNLYVSFLDSRQTQRKVSNHVHLYFTRSTDGGKSWSVNKQADVLSGGIGGTCECCTENIASSPEGHVYITFRSNINNLRDIWLARSFDKGMTFQSAIKIMSGDWNISECPVSGPNIALDDSEGAHIVWRDARDDSGGMSHLYYAHVPSGSNETPVNVAFDAAGASSANYPDVSLFDHNRFKVIVYQTANFGMRYILSDAQTNLVNNRPLPAGNSQQFGSVVFSSDGTRYLSWQDNTSSSGPTGVYFSTETMPLSSAGVIAKPNPSEFTVFPNPVSAGEVTITYAVNSHATMRFVDILGREVMRTALASDRSSQTLSVSELPAGSYFCILESEQAVRTTRVVVSR